MAGEKKLGPERQDAARAFVRAILDRDFHGNISHAAKKFGVSQSLLSEFLSGGRGAGTKLLGGVADYAGVTWDEIVGRSSTAESTTLRRHSDWDRVATAAAELHRGEIEERFFREAGDWAAVTGLPERIDVPFVAALARELQALAKRAGAASAQAQGSDGANASARTGTVSKIPKGGSGDGRQSRVRG